MNTEGHWLCKSLEDILWDLDVLDDGVWWEFNIVDLMKKYEE